RGDGDRRPASDNSRPGQGLHVAPAPPPRGPPRDHRLGPDPGTRRHPLGGADRARRLLRRASQHLPRRPHPHQDRWPSPNRSRPRSRLGFHSMSDRPAVSLRIFQPSDKAAVHRWFNNPAATASLMEQRDSFSLEEAGSWVQRAIDDSGEDRKYAIVVEGYEEPVGFTALYG